VPSVATYPRFIVILHTNGGGYFDGSTVIVSALDARSAVTAANDSWKTKPAAGEIYAVAELRRDGAAGGLARRFVVGHEGYAWEMARSTYQPGDEF
jgi:hypothetical protein